MDCLRRCDGDKKTTKRGQSPGTCAGIPSTEGQVAGPGAGREKRQPWEKGCFGGERGTSGQGMQTAWVTLISHLASSI